MRGAVRVDDLWVEYRRLTRRGSRRRGPRSWGLQGVALECAPGECVGVIGRNGSGKSTLLQTIAGVVRPTRGTVNVTGRVASLVDLAAGFHRELTGRENLIIAGVLLGLTRGDVRSRLERIQAFTELDDNALAAPLRTYSSGMALRLGFALTVTSDAEVLLVDEVLAVGDAEFQRKCVDAVRAHRDAGGAVILVSHDLELVIDECDRVLTLHQGSAVGLGPPAEAVARYLDLTGETPDTR